MSRAEAEPVPHGGRHSTASCVVIDSAVERVLLVLHKRSGLYQFPGGHLRDGEGPDEAAVREVREETDVLVTLWDGDRLTVPNGVWRPSPILTCDFQAPADPTWHEPEHVHTDLLFLATADSRTPIVPQVDEVDDARWQRVADLNQPRLRRDVPILAPIAWRILREPRPS